MDRFIQRRYFDDELSTMLGSVDANVLEAILRSTKPSNFKIPKDKRNREGISKMLRFDSNLSDLELLEKLYEAESNRPFKHVLLSRYEGDVLGITEEILGSEFSFQNNILGIDGFSCTYFRDYDEYFEFTLEHVDDSIHYYYEENARISEIIPVRHPFVVTVSKKKSVILVSFPGYSRQVRNDYEDLLSEVAFIFSDRYGVQLLDFPIKKIIGTFLEKRSPRFIFDHVGGKNLKGSLGLKSSTEGFSVDDLLPNLMAESLPLYSENQIRDALIGAIKKFHDTSEVLFWIQESVYTSLHYYGFGTELYFTWKGVSPEYERVWSIITFLVSVSASVESENDILPIILNGNADTTFTRESLIAQTGLSSDEVTKQLAKYVTEGLLKTLYKVKDGSQFANSLTNKWHNSLEILNKEIFNEFELDSLESRLEVLKSIEVSFIPLKAEGIHGAS